MGKTTNCLDAHVCRSADARYLINLIVLKGRLIKKIMSMNGKATP